MELEKLELIELQKALLHWSDDVQGDTKRKDAGSRSRRKIYKKLEKEVVKREDDRKGVKKKYGVMFRGREILELTANTREAARIKAVEELAYKLQDRASYSTRDYIQLGYSMEIVEKEVIK